MRYAFSLVELSIVLVILGLLTGGILGGQALIRAAELRSISNDFNRYVTAAHTFRDKYLALPGDMRNATKFWGAQTGSTNEGVDAACAALLNGSPATGAPTCNGDGNGQISNDDFGAGNNASWFEVWRAWQHLANAGLVEGTQRRRLRVCLPRLPEYRDQLGLPGHAGKLATLRGWRPGGSRQPHFRRGSMERRYENG